MLETVGHGKYKWAEYAVVERRGKISIELTLTTRARLLQMDIRGDDMVGLLEDIGDRDPDEVMGELFNLFALPEVPYK